MKRFLIAILFTFVAIPALASTPSRFPKPSIIDDSLKIHSVRIEWQEQEHVDYYRIKLYDNSCQTVLRSKNVSADRTKKKLKHLSSGTDYCVRMRAFYTDGTRDRLSKRLRFTTLNTTEESTEDSTSNTDETSTQEPTLITHYDRFGLNFIRINTTENDAIAQATLPEVVDADFTALGIDTFRQFTSADLIWSNINTISGDNYETEDSVLLNTAHAPIATLFSYQLADGTTPTDELMGDSTPEGTVTTEQEEYIGGVVDRYKGYVKYWEIGNEMAHWELEQPGVFPVANQAVWLKSVAEVIRAHDADAVIVLAGLISITEDNVDDWLGPVIDSVGSDWFDIVNYHHYSSWLHYTNDRAALQSFIDAHGLGDKPVWLTETGTSSDVTNTARTNYPNSESQQAADIFRRSLLAYAAGDELVMWHTYIGNDDDGEDFRYFGIVNEDLTKQLAYYTTQLLTSEITQFSSIEQQGSDFVYAVTRQDNSTAYVAWSATTQSYTIPAGVTQMTSVVPNEDGTFTWETVTPGNSITLANIPVLLK